jgi:hypothetical protein
MGMTDMDVSTVRNTAPTFAINGNDVVKMRQPCGNPHECERSLVNKKLLKGAAGPFRALPGPLEGARRLR